MNHEKKDGKATVSRGEDSSISVDPILFETLDYSHAMYNIATEARLEDRS